MDMERKLKEVLCQLPGAVVTGKVNDQVICDLTIDSRTVAPGSLFICLKGVNTDGHKYIGKAVEQGAAAILVEENVAPVEGTVLMRMVGVTGTNGKTTTTNILRTLLTRTGHKVGLIGTINVMIGDDVRKSHNTTPDVVDLQKILYEMVEAHCDTCVMEVSSHALALRRVAGIEYDTAVLTNITQDHLDFHKTMENYREAKALLFTHLHEGVKPNKTAIFNADDPSSALIMPRVKTKIMTYGKGKDNDVYPLTFHVAATHMELNLHTPVGEMDLKLHITGEFNVYNVMGGPNGPSWARLPWTWLTSSS